MFNLSDDYQLRNCYFQRKQVPTQSIIKKKMSPPLAAVYFNSMSPKLKVLAGLEPLLKGGGGDWYVPPTDLLEGRTVLKPVNRDLLAKVSCDGIIEIGTQCFKRHLKAQNANKESALLEADINWRKNVISTCAQKWQELVEEAKNKEIEHMTNAFDCFSHLYRMSMTKLEKLFHESAIAQIKKYREMVTREMQSHLDAAVKWQAVSYYHEFGNKLANEKAQIKAEFLEKLETSRTHMADKIHDLRVDKFVVIEKLRKFMEAQNMACQVYVALKEREECLKGMEESKHKHQKKVKTLSEKIAFKSLELHFAEEKKRRRREFKLIWQKKVCHVLKKAQLFVSYCINMLPEHAEFFINMEKLMLLQLNETLEEPTAESIIELEERFHTPSPRPRPFYLFCDKGHKPHVDQDLCPKHCASDTSQLPVVVVNGKFIYAACDNFQQFSNKVKDFLYGKRGDDADFKDDHIYEHYVPVKYTSSEQLLELKLESSLLQVLQQEIPNIRDVPFECSLCGIAHCFCTPSGYMDKEASPSPSPILAPTSGHKLVADMRKIELKHEREPKWESYLEYAKPKKCTCAKTAKKHLFEQMPAYMRRMSQYEDSDLANYEKCSFTTLKTLVQKARESSSASSLPKVSSKKDVSTQYSDPDFDLLCTCFSDSEMYHLLSGGTIGPIMLKSSKTGNGSKFVDGSVSSTNRIHRKSSSRICSGSCNARAYSLRNVINNVPDVQEIFMKKDCT